MHQIPGRILLIVAAFALFLVPVAVIAANGFDDVPDDNVFKADIEWLADAGVTKGCNPPANTEFCPGSNVTRQQMAAFMHRLAVNKVVNAATADEAAVAGNADKLDGKDSTAFAASGHDHDAAYLAKTGKAVDSDKLDGFSVESIAPRATGTNFEVLGGVYIDEIVASVAIDAPARGIIIANATGDTYYGTSAQACYLLVDATYPGGMGYVDHAQDNEADCTTSGSLVVDAGVHTIDLWLTGDAIHIGHLWAMWVPFDGTGAVPAAATLGSVELDLKSQN